VQCRASGGPCDVAENCDGANTACPADAKQSTTVVCRPAADQCDVAETCDGANNACPTDAKQPSGTVCRPSGGICDIADSCDGLNNACPADAKQPAGTTCRAAAGVCDQPEVCNGSSDLCPSDSKKPSGTVCRASAGVCDVAEVCNGTGDSCPGDGFASSSTVCRPSASACDVAENCTGSGPTCPADTGLPDTDGDGVCDALDDCPNVSDPSQLDSDGDGKGDACDPCNNVGPTFATKSKLIVTKLFSGPGDDKFKLKGYMLLSQTPAVRPDLNGLRLMLQNVGGSGIGTPAFDATLPSGAYNVVQRVGWKINGSTTKFVYKNAGNPVPLVFGINKASIGLVTRTPGLIKFSFGGKNGDYSDSMNPLVAGSLPLKATLILDVAPHSSTTQCGETNFAAGNCLLVSAGNTAKCQLQ
jgi:hypothetical protein